MNVFQRALLGMYVGLAVVVLATDHVFLVVNLTDSLPGRLFVVLPGAFPQRDELLAYRWHGGAGYPRDSIIVKRRAGLPGDRITLADRTVFLNGDALGVAKTASRRGIPLTAIAAGVIPSGHSYVAAPHPDSLDSRYALTGLVSDEQVIGRAHVLF